MLRPWLCWARPRRCRWPSRSAPWRFFPVKGESLAAESPQDFLRQDSSVFLEERGAGGGQADLVLRGGSFEQTLVLLNGFRINDAQTSHHNLDLPVPLEAMDSIQVLEGSGSTLHGVDALSGVVDFLTAAPDHDSVLLRAGEGSFESNEETLLAGATRGSLSGRVTAERNFSTGFMTDRDYRNEDASAESWIGSRLGVTDLLFAASDRSFGANQFYGPYNSWERTKGWFASARQELGSQTVAAFGYRRHTDEFVLFRDDPAIYENNHIDGSWQASLRRTEKLLRRLAAPDRPGGRRRQHPQLQFSGGVTSFALGIHARNRGAGYVDLDLRPAKKRWSLSAGAREEIFSGGAQAVFSPELAGSFRAANSLKLRASGGYGFRIPTYTDLYYSDPSTLGNPNLKPESAWSGDAGADWTPSAKLSLSFTGFYSHQHDTIDYVKSATVPNPYLPACLPSEHLVRRQPERSALCRRRIHADLDSEQIAEGAHRLDRLARRAERFARARVGVRLQLPGPEHSRRLDLGAGPRFRSHQRGPDCRALPADGLSGVERHADARRMETAALSAAHESEQHRLPGDQRREHAAANDHGRHCAATGTVRKDREQGTKGQGNEGTRQESHKRRRAPSLQLLSAARVGYHEPLLATSNSVQAECFFRNASERWRASLAAAAL